MKGWSETRKTLAGAYSKTFGFLNGQEAIPTGGKTAANRPVFVSDIC